MVPHLRTKVAEELYLQCICDVKTGEGDFDYVHVVTQSLSMFKSQESQTLE